MTTTAGRPSQGERRARSRAALLEAAARGISRHGYANLVLEEVAAEAGFTRGALYHQFSGKEDLVLAVVAWVEQTWWEEMADITDSPDDPVQALVTVARRHAVFCRRDIARVATALRVEFTDHSEPIGEAVHAARKAVVDQCTLLVRQARRSKRIKPGAPDSVVAAAIVGAVEGLVIDLAGRTPYDERLAERAVLGLLGV